MKLALAFLLAGTLPVLGQSSMYYPPAPNPLNAVSASDQQAMRVQQARNAARYFVPPDPWRLIRGTPTYAKGPNWVEFAGRVLEVQTNGIRVMGDYGEPFLISGQEKQEFFVAHYPYRVAANQWVGFKGNAMHLTAYDEGNTYATAAGGNRPLRKLDYGTPCPAPPPTREQLEEMANAKQQAEANVAAAQLKALKLNEDQAAKGDPYGLLRMGERYRDGDGVTKDLAKARDYLAKAAGAGEPSAAAELSKLDPATNAPAGVR